MSDTRRDGPARALFWTAAVAGPAATFLHEIDVVPLGPPASLWPLVLIVAAALLGILLGLRIEDRVARRVRWLAVVPNGLVLCFYGFLLLFFGLGGSR